MTSLMLAPIWILPYAFLASVSGMALPVAGFDDVIDDIIDLNADHLVYDANVGGNFIDTTQYYFRHNMDESFTKLHPNPHIDLNAPLCTVENGSVICQQGQNQSTNFYYDEDRDVSVSITKENGTIKLGGLVRTSDGVYEYQPIAHAQKANAHVRKKRWTANVFHRRVSRGKQTFPSFKPRRKWGTPTRSSSASSEYCVDILCVVDYSIYKKFKDKHITDSETENRIRYYYAHVINGINMRYASLEKSGIKLRVRLAGYFIAKKSKDLPFMKSYEIAKLSGARVNSRRTLEELDKFIKKVEKDEVKKSPFAKRILPDFNHAMLFLEYTATSMGGTVLGTSFVMGICSASHSTSLVVDHGAYTSSGIGCHELGHNLGVKDHDGEGNATVCNASMNYVMAPASYLVSTANLQYSFTFSPCSIHQIKTLLERVVAGSRNCLTCGKLPVPAEKAYRAHLEQLPGERATVHEQCRQLYGPGSFMCPPKQPREMCYRMYCYDPKRSACAIISEQMAIPGTPCGNKKWCMLGQCISHSRAPAVPDDCPYPDIPQTGAHCEDATPFMCENEKFRKKCCNSCNKKFTQEESCKDTHVPINGMQCPALMNQRYAKAACQHDNNVKNYCCRSCRALLLRVGTGPTVVHIGGTGNHLSPRRTSWNTVSKNRPTSSRMKSRGVQRSSMRSVMRQVSRNSIVPGSQGAPSVVRNVIFTSRSPECTDNRYLRINDLTCAEVVKAQPKLACAHKEIARYCCKSCNNIVR